MTLPVGPFKQWIPLLPWQVLPPQELPVTQLAKARTIVIIMAAATATATTTVAATIARATAIEARPANSHFVETCGRNGAAEFESLKRSRGRQIPV